MPARLTPAVVVLAYNRPAALRRLLDSLLRGPYPDADVRLVISIDAGSGPAAAEVQRMAASFNWSFGTKAVVQQAEHLGVVRHFQAGGRFTLEYGSAIVLEDDLTVAPGFLEFATQVLERYGRDDRIAGFCLYALWFNGFTQEPFLPLHDGSDVFFLRLPYTQGLAFSASQWQAFDQWSARHEPGPHPHLHSAFEGFGQDEWFPGLAYYLASTGRFFCFPRVSLTAGWGDRGTHFRSATSWFQTPLQMRAFPASLPPLENALALYDSFYELLPDRMRALSPSLRGVDFDVDLNATKEARHLTCGHLLTSRPVRHALQTFGLRMYPPERNVIESVEGNEIALARREDVEWDALASPEARRRLQQYAWLHHRPSRRRALGFLGARIISQTRAWRGTGINKWRREEQDGPWTTYK